MSRYEQVLRHIRYRNWRPAALESRRFRIKCSELNGRYTSNEFNLEVSESCGDEGSPSSPIHSLIYSGNCHHWSTGHSRSEHRLPALARSASSMRSESRTVSTSTTLSRSHHSSSPSTTRSPRLASSTVQVGHLGGGTSGCQVVIATQHLGCSSQN